MELTSAAEPTDNGRLLWAIVRRRWVVVVVAALAGAAIAGYVGSSRTTTYTSTAELLLNPVQGLPYSPGARGERMENLVTEIQLATSDPVATAAATALHETGSPAALAKKVVAVNPPNSQIVRLTFTDSSPAEARRGARAFGDAFLDYRGKRSEQSIEAGIDRLEKAVTVNQLALAESNKRLAAAAPGSAAAIIAAQDVRSAQQALSKLAGAINDRRAADTSAGTYLSPPTSDAPSRRVPTAILVLVGAVFGAALGVALAIWLGLGDKRLHQVSDLERFGLFVIGSARRRHDRDGETTRQLLTQSTAELDDDVRIARIVLTARAAKSTTLVIAPAARFPRSNGTTVAALAAALARTHTPVTLVDAASDLLGGNDWEPGEYGLADALTLGFPLERVAVETQPHLTFVPWGRHPSPGTDILSTRDLAKALTSVEQEGGWLLISAPPLDRPESLALASMLGKVVLRVELGRTTLDEVKRAVDEAARCGAEIVGALVETSSGIPWTPGARGPGASTTVALSERMRAGSEPVGRMARAPRPAPKT